jgi:hypothetical protein
MRIKNKEIRRRRHRKEQTIKAAQREIRSQYSGESKPAVTAAPTAKKPVAKKSPAEAPKKAAPKPKKAEA